MVTSIHGCTTPKRGASGGEAGTARNYDIILVDFDLFLPGLAWPGLQKKQNVMSGGTTCRILHMASPSLTDASFGSI